MMNEIWRYLAVTLTAACLGQGYYIHARKALLTPAAQDFQARHDQWVADVEALQGQAFENWFQAKVAVSGIRSAVKVTENQVIVSITVPGLKAETLKVVINDVLIRASYSARSFVEEKAAGGSYRREGVREFETVMPIPGNADPRKHRFSAEGEGFKIIFEKREDPSLKS